MKKKLISALLASGMLFQIAAGAATLDNVTYDYATGRINVSGTSKGLVSVFLLEKGKTTDSLSNVSNANNPYKSIGVTSTDANGTYSYNFNATLEAGQEYILGVADSDEMVTQPIGGAEEVSDSYKIYVNNSGNDGNDGTEGYPVKTVQQAAELAKIHKESNPIGNIDIIITSGTYELTSPVTLTAENSGSATGRITYKAQDNGKVVFTGAKELDYSAFVKVTDKDILNRIPNAARDKVRVINIETQSIAKNALAVKYNKTTKMAAPVELYFNGKKQDIAQWPNAGFAPVGAVNEAKTGFTIPEDKASKWRKATSAYIQGYIEQAFYRQANKFSVENNAVILENNPALMANGKYRIINAIEELDMPGEFYTDSESGKLYFYPPKDITYKDEISVSVYSDSFFELNGADYITIENIEFKNSGLSNHYEHGAVIETYAIDATDADYVEIKNVTVDNCMGSGIKLSGYNSVISGCTVYNMGGHGISISGGELESLTAGNTSATDNYTYSLSEYQSPHSAGNLIGGVGNTMSNNVFHRSDGTLLTFGGTDLNITNNEFYNGTIETKDSGLVYHQGSFVSYGNEFLYNYFHDVQLPNDNYTGDTALNNALYWDNLLSGQTAKYNIFNVGNDANRAFLTSGRDNEFSYNTVIGGKEVAFADWTSFYWSQGFGEEGTLTPYAVNGLNKLKTIPHSTSPWIDRFPQVNELYNDLVTETDASGNPTKYGLFIPKKSTIDGNVLINTDSNVNIVVGEAKTVQSYKGNDIFGDIARLPYDKFKYYEEEVEANNTLHTPVEQSAVEGMFVDYAGQDLRLKTSAKSSYGLDDGLVDENNFEMTSIGNTTARSVTNSAFNLVYPANNAEIDSGKINLKWEKADFADKYTYKVATDGAMTNVVAEGEVFEECAEISGLAKNTKYYWTVEAHNLSRQNAAQWSSSRFTFTTTGNDIKINTSAITGDDGTYAGFTGGEFVLELDMDNITSSDLQSYAFVAVYGDTNKFKNAVKADIVVPASSDDKAYVITGDLGQENLTDCTVNLLIWDKSTLKPFIKKLEIWK